MYGKGLPVLELVLLWASERRTGAVLVNHRHVPKSGNARRLSRRSVEGGHPTVHPVGRSSRVSEPCTGLSVRWLRGAPRGTDER